MDATCAAMGAESTAMIAIVLSTCLVADPGVCRDQIIPLLSEVSILHCTVTAQPHMAQWNEEHPQWRVVRWRCRSTGRRDI